MALPDIAKNMIREALGEDVLQRALAADNKAVIDTKTLDGLGIASKNYDQYTGSQVLEAAQKVQSFIQTQTDLDARLKAAEEKVKQTDDLMATIKTLQETVRQLTEKLDAAETRETAAQESMKDMQEKLALFTDLKPPASQSSETLLNDREKTLVDSVMSAAKAADAPSLVEKLVGGSPAISSS